MRRDKLVSLARALNTAPVVLMGLVPYDPDAKPTRDSVISKLESILVEAGYLKPGEQLTPELLNSISVALETAIEIYRKNHE